MLSETLFKRAGSAGNCCRSQTTEAAFFYWQPRPPANPRCHLFQLVASWNKFKEKLLPTSLSHYASHKTWYKCIVHFYLKQVNNMLGQPKRCAFATTRWWDFIVCTMLIQQARPTSVPTCKKTLELALFVKRGFLLHKKVTLLCRVRKKKKIENWADTLGSKSHMLYAAQTWANNFFKNTEKHLCLSIMVLGSLQYYNHKEILEKSIYALVLCFLVACYNTVWTSADSAWVHSICCHSAICCHAASRALVAEQFP